MNTLRIAYSLVIVALAALMATVRPTASRVETVDLGEPAKGATEDVVEAVEDEGESQAITGEAITQPDVPRVLTVTAGGEANDIKAIKVKVEGTDAAGEAITEEIGPFTVNEAGTKTGKKAFATITKVTIPAHDGEEATTAVGLGQAIGLGFKLSRNSVVAAFLGGVKEGTAPTVVVSSTVLSENVATLNSELDGESAVLLDFYR